MQTNLAAAIKDTPQGREADAILRSCVHCGFCLATCPTYQLLGDELDSPRGRIYLMKQMLEGEPVTAETQLHLDRCLTCRACETTCPSGVRYGKLLDIGRALAEERVGRLPLAALRRYALRLVLPYRGRFAALYSVARFVRVILPRELRSKLSDVVHDRTARTWPAARHARKIIFLEGCVQPTLAPETNIAAAHVLDRIGISVIRVSAAGCCGAVAHHLSAHEQTHQQLRRNIDAIWPHVEAGAEAVVMAASACTAMLTDYAHLLREDARYAERAARVSALSRDISEIVLTNAEALRQALRQTKNAQPGPKVAFQSPCTLQHALKVRGVVESLLSEAGFSLTHVPDSHLCCGSAGTYSLLQPELSSRLLSAKVAALEQGGPAVIATANIGCQTHLRSGTSLPVRHWVELLAMRLSGRPPPPHDQSSIQDFRSERLAG
jgi:glycolate dehydrogenase iron-sulfur subunit